jgi:hypothetical protein
VPRRCLELDELLAATHQPPRPPLAGGDLPLWGGLDAVKARALADYLKLDHVGWSHIVWKANQLGKNREFRTLAVRIADELERREVLTSDDLNQIYDDVREEERCST